MTPPDDQTGQAVGVSDDDLGPADDAPLANERNTPARSRLFPVPSWLVDLTELCWRLLVVAAAFGVLMWSVVAIRAVAVPVVVAVIIACVLRGPVRSLEHRGIPRPIAASIVVVLAGGLTLAIVVGVGSLVVAQLADRGDDVTRIEQQLRTWLADGPLALSESDVAELAESARSALVGGLRSQVTSQAWLVVQIGAAVLLGFVLSLLFVVDGPRLWAWMLDHTAPNRRAALDRAGRSAAESLTGYVTAVAIAGLLDGVLIGIGLWALGVPLAVPLALLTAVAAFFPVVGATFSGGLAAVVALVTVGPGTAIWVVVLTLAVQILEGNVVIPLVMGRRTSLHPAVVLCALALGGVVAGLAGAFLAVPVTAAAVAAASTWRQERFAQGGSG